MKIQPEITDYLSYRLEKSRSMEVIYNTYLSVEIYIFEK